jgi:phage tail sheath protein FI
MGVFVSSKSSVSRHGVFAIAKTPPAIIAAIGTGVACIVAQFPWGPDGADEGVVTPADAATRALQIAPPGMVRTGDGYLSTIQKGFPTLKYVRVLGTTAAKASASLLDGVTACLTVTLKYKGAAGNSVDCVVADATDGDANHFNLTVRVTSASGTTEDIFENLNYSGTGDDSDPDLSALILVGALTKAAAGRPDNGTTSCTGGLDGTVTAADYTGTAGTGNKGIAACEGDKSIRVVFTDDAGDALRAAVNAGLRSHAILMGDRIVIVNGDSGNTLAEAQTDVANYRSTRVVYVDPWVYTYDDTDGSERLVSPSSFAAAVITQVSPSTSPAWKDQEVGDMLAGVVRLESSRGDGAGANTKLGIMTMIQEEGGGFRYEAGKLTTLQAGQTNITRTRMGDYIAVSFVRSARSFVDAPNLAFNQGLLTGALDQFMIVLKQAQNEDPNHTPHVVDYGYGDLAAANPQASRDAGDFNIPLEVKTSSSMERIFLEIQYGETVTVTAS